MPPKSAIAENLARVRKERGLSPGELAKKVNVRLYTIQAIESGKTRKSKHLPDIARELGVRLEEIDPSQKTATSGERPPTIEQLSTGRRDLPLHATTDGGEGVLVMSSDPIRYIVRPTSLEGIADAYAVIIRGESMGQVAPHGAIVAVDPHIPAQRGDICVFRALREGDFYSTVKELVGMTKDNWKVKRYYPKEEEFTLKRRDWPECHVVVTIHRR